jgi:dipeptidyl aminopeptidase/acylaminoacyl peptidase
VAALLLAALGVAQAAVPELRRGQGLLVLGVASDVPIDRLRIERLDGPFGGWTRAFTEGDSVALRAVPAGSYRIALIEFHGGRYIDLPSRFDLVFDVREGVASYPGTLELRQKGFSAWSATLTNRAARIIGALERQHGAAAPSIEYTGRGPDPFPQFLRDLRAATPGNALPAAVPFADEPVARGIPAATIFDTRGVAAVRISPDGRRIADASRTADGWRVAVLDLTDGEAIEVYAGPLPVTDIAWASAQTLVIGAWAGFSGSRAVVVRFDGRAGGRPVRAEVIPYEGRLLSRVRGDPGRIVFLRQVVGDDDPLQLHRVAVDGARIKHGDFRRAARLDAGLDDDSGWLVDSSGALRIAITGELASRKVMFREGNGRKWRQLLAIDSLDTFLPVAMAADGRGFYAVTDHGRAQRDLLRYRVDDPTSPEVVHSLAGTDIENAIVRAADGAVIGVQYQRDGQLESVHFDEGLRSLQAGMRAALPGQRVAIIDLSDDGKRALVLASGPTDPGTWYLLDRRAATLEPLGRFAPHLADLAFREPQLVEVPSGGGATLQAILTMPEPGPARAPLVVMPHGGPIAVADNLEFDRAVQYLVSRGYAVLQVNYRGSDGFGRAFREAGMRSQGRGIEDDIEAAIDHVLARHPLDRDRVALAGASYGGYSALMGLVRAPDRYRCAVSIAGVGDIPLQFTSSDSSRDAARRALLARIWGDPLQELDALRQVSPVYRGDAIRAPVLLVHGLDDERVVSEHSERMRLVLQLRGAAVSTVAIEDEGHSLSGPGTRARVYGHVAAFLDRCLAARAG